MKFYLGVTDNSWYNYLSARSPEDVNFWQPGGNTGFKVIVPGSPFLFKLKSPLNVVAGIGFFSSHTFLPLSVAWDVFETRNGTDSYEEFKRLIFQYRQEKQNTNPNIGCIILTNPLFFKREDWIPVPADWSKSIVKGKSYDTETEIGKSLWKRIEINLQKYLVNVKEEDKNQLSIEESAPKYGNAILTKVRLGQGAFRIMVTDSYNRKCAITGEKTLPVLEAAHIKPYAKSGPHYISNALLLRSDLHKRFDTGYITITPEFRIEVSKRLKEEYSNGKEYYRYQGSELLNLPNSKRYLPDKLYVEWHNENIYR